MKSTLRRSICHFLVIAIAMFPFQSGQASMIGTDQVISAASAQADRNTVLSFLGRSETINQLQALGIDAKSAENRVAAMTDDEVRTLAGKIHSVPAGGDGGLALLVLVVFFIWYFAFRR